MAVIRAILKYDRAMFAREGFAGGDMFRMWSIKRMQDVPVTIHDFSLDELVEIYWREDDHPRHHMDVTVCHPRDFE